MLQVSERHSIVSEEQDEHRKARADGREERAGKRRADLKFSRS